MSQSRPDLKPASSDAASHILIGTDPEGIRHVLRAGLAERILAKSGEYPHAVSLFQDTPSIFENSGGEEIFKARYAALDERERAAYLRFGLVESLANQAATRIALMNAPDDRANNPYHLETVLEIVKAAGLGPEYTEAIFSQVWKGYTATPHPTGYLNEVSQQKGEPDAVDRFIDLIDINVFPSGHDVPEGELYNEAAKALDSLLEMGDLTPTRRSTTLEELMFVSRFGLKYVNARTRTLDAIVDAHEAVFGTKKNAHYPPNFTRSQCLMDMALRAWQGGDYDGKPNAEHWTLMAAQVVSTYMAVSNHLWRLEQANRILKGEKPENLNLTFEEAWARFEKTDSANGNIHPELQDLHALLFDLKADLHGIFTDIEYAMNAMTDPDLSGEQRAEKFREFEPAFQDVKNRMGVLYDHRRFKGRTLKSDHGLDVYERLLVEFKRLREIGPAASWPEAAVTLFEDAAEDLRMDGMALFKIEPRHNNHVNNQIVDNLYKLDGFRNHVVKNNILTLEDLRFIDAAGGFSKLDLGDIHRIACKVEAALGKTGRLREFLVLANPEGYDDNGYPLQTWGTLRRLEVMEQYQLKFGPMVILAEGDEKSERINSFIFKDYHLDLMVHTPLTEDHASISDTHNAIERNHRNGASERSSKRTRSKVPEQFRRAGRAGMFARSDITREFGQFSGPLVYGQAQRNAQTAAKLGITSFAYEGSGLSNERGGGDPMVMVRLIAQALQEYQDLTGEQLDAEILSMASSVIHTVQGREMYKTETEIAREMQNQLAEIIGIRLELQGHVKKGTFIPQKDKFSPAMEKFLQMQVHKMMHMYSAVRNARVEGADDATLNTLALIASDPAMAGHTNNAARMLSKVTGNKAARLTDQRAIGNNIWIALMRTHHDGWYTVGRFMEELHNAAQNGFEDEEGRHWDLKSADVSDLVNSKYWDYNLFLRALTPLARADFEHGMRRLNMTDGWDHDRLMAQGAQAGVQNGRFIFTSHEAGVTDQQAYFAGLYAEGQTLAASTNALADGTFTQTAFDVIRTRTAEDRKSGDTSIQFNAAAKQRWPFLDQVREASERSKPALAIMDLYEAEIAARKSAGEKPHNQAELRAAASYWRGTTIAPIEHIVIDYTRSYGRRDEPLPANPRDVLVAGSVIDFPARPRADEGAQAAPTTA